MGPYGQIPWRYDLQTQTIDYATPLQGLPTGRVEDSTVSSSGEITILTGRRLYSCQGGRRWQALPAPADGFKPFSINYDPTGKLLCAASYAKESVLFEWRQEKWRRVRSLPPCRAFIPAKGGLILLGDKDTLTFLPDDADADAPATETAFPTSVNPWSRYPLAGRYCVFPVNDGLLDSIYTWRKAWWARTGGLEEAQIDATLLGVDLPGQDLLRLRETKRDENGVTVKVEGVADLESLRIDLPVDQYNYTRVVPIRDGNGHLWIANRRWDGRAWREITPSRPLPPRFADRCDLFRLDLATDTWVCTEQDVPPRVAAFDPGDRTGWLIDFTGGQWRYRLVRFSPGGQKTLKEIKTDKAPGGPRFRTAQGEWWFQNGQRVSRLADDLPESYELESLGGPYLDAADDVWLRIKDGFARFDRGANRFAPAPPPWEAFSFRFGDWTLARLADGPGLSEIYCKIGGDWLPFKGLGGAGSVMGGPRMIHGRRMIVTVSGVGVVEYDADLRRSILLDDRQDWWRVGFDADGRPLLIDALTALLYDGDPFEQTPYLGTRAAELLARMDGDRLKDREAATREMLELARHRQQMIYDLLRQDLSAEVRARLRDILPRIPSLMPEQGLFRHMHPLLEPGKPMTPQPQTRPGNG